MRRLASVGLALFATATASADDALPPHAALNSILFWTPAQQESGYRTIENIFPPA